MAGPVDGASQALLQRARALGITIRPAQSSTSPFINKMDQMIGKIPGSGMGKDIEKQHAEFNNALAQTMGEDAHAITPDVMLSAKKRLGNEFDTVEKNTTVKFDQPLASKLSTILGEASSVLEPGQVEPLANRITNISKLAKGGQFDGKTFNNMLKTDSPLDRLRKNQDTNVRFYADQIRGALQDALERHATPDMAQRYNMARMQYKNMKTIQPLAEKAPTGDISPALLAAQVRKANPNFAYGSGGDIADIARIGQRYLRSPPDSGTPLGALILNLAMKSVPGAIGGGAATYAGGGNPLEGAGAGIGAMLGAGATARMANRFMNNPKMLERGVNLLPYLSTTAKNVANQ
jgi:hypothetical protein